MNLSQYKIFKFILVLSIFYQCFIWNFSKIAILLILILKTTILIDLIPKILGIDNNEVVRDRNKADKMFKIFSKYKKLKNNKSENLVHISNIEVMEKLIFLTFDARKAFNRLK